MSKAYKDTRHTIKFNNDNIHDAFSVHTVSYGLLSTDEVAGERVLATKIEARGG